MIYVKLSNFKKSCFQQEDKDGDGIPDHLDNDDDGDGIPDDKVSIKHLI